MDLWQRVGMLEVDKRPLPTRLAAIQVHQGADGGGDAPPERARGLGLEIVSAHSDVGASIQLPPSSPFALSLDDSLCLSLYFRTCWCLVRHP